MATSLIGIVVPPLLAIAASMQAPATNAQPIAVPDNVVIRLERTACLGECPVYTVAIDGRGNVQYDGVKFVRVEGHQTDRIPVSRVIAILETAERIGFFGLRNQYRVIRNADGSSTAISDLPTAFVTITREGRTKRIEDYLGAPEELQQLERQIDEAARTKRWILLDAPTLAQLVRDGWSPTSDERAELFRRAIEEDEPAVVKGLIDLGADPNGGYYGTNTPPLMMVRSAAVARVLIDAGANPNAVNDNGGTPLWWSVYLASDVGQLLLKAGAHVDGPSDRDGRTPLWHAACLGHADLVAALLAAGADPTVRASGQSVLDCARQSHEGERLSDALLLDRRPPYVRDFDRVIALLEQALSKRQRR